MGNWERTQSIWEDVHMWNANPMSFYVRSLMHLQYSLGVLELMTLVGWEDCTENDCPGIWHLIGEFFKSSEPSRVLGELLLCLTSSVTCSCSSPPVQPCQHQIFQMHRPSSDSASCKWTSLCPEVIALHGHLPGKCHALSSPSCSLNPAFLVQDQLPLCSFRPRSSQAFKNNHSAAR